MGEVATAHDSAASWLNRRPGLPRPFATVVAKRIPVSVTLDRSPRFETRDGTRDAALVRPVAGHDHDLRLGQSLSSLANLLHLVRTSWADAFLHRRIRRQEGAPATRLIAIVKFGPGDLARFHAEAHEIWRDLGVDVVAKRGADFVGPRVRAVGADVALYRQAVSSVLLVEEAGELVLGLHADLVGLDNDKESRVWVFCGVFSKCLDHRPRLSGRDIRLGEGHRVGDPVLEKIARDRRIRDRSLIRGRQVAIRLEVPQLRQQRHDLRSAVRREVHPPAREPGCDLSSADRHVGLQHEHDRPNGRKRDVVDSAGGRHPYVAGARFTPRGRQRQIPGLGDVDRIFPGVGAGDAEHLAIWAPDVLLIDDSAALTEPVQPGRTVCAAGGAGAVAEPENHRPDDRLVSRAHAGGETMLGQHLGADELHRLDVGEKLEVMRREIGRDSRDVVPHAQHARLSGGVEQRLHRVHQLDDAHRRPLRALRCLRGLLRALRCLGGMLGLLLLGSARQTGLHLLQLLLAHRRGWLALLVRLAKNRSHRHQTGARTCACACAYSCTCAWPRAADTQDRYSPGGETIPHAAPALRCHSSEYASPRRRSSSLAA